MTVHTPDLQVRAVRATRHRVAGLLGRYPQVSDQDRKEILAFMKEGRHLDIGLLTADENVRPQLDAFMADHERHFKLNVLDMLRALAVVGAVLIVCRLIWELFMPVSL